MSLNGVEGPAPRLPVSEGRSMARRRRRPPPLSERRFRHPGKRCSICVARHFGRTFPGDPRERSRAERHEKGALRRYLVLLEVGRSRRGAHVPDLPECAEMRARRG